jgi:HEAT repeats
MVRGNTWGTIARGGGEGLVAARRAQAAAVALALMCSAAHAQPSAAGRALLPATETARATVAGRVADVARLDRAGYSAIIQVDRVLAGAVQPGESVRIGWEELFPARPPRFADGQRVVLALDDLPHASLWRQRFPDGDRVFVVAARGDAWLVDPIPGDLDLLAAYTQLGARPPSAARATALSRIAGGATPLLAEAAVARLESLPDAHTALDAAAVERLMQSAGDAQTPLRLRLAIIALAGHARLSTATRVLETFAQSGAPLEAAALAALGEIRGGLTSPQVEELLDRRDPEVRAVGARFATGALAERRLPSLARQDPSPLVRAAAAAALAGTHTLWGVDGAIPALADPDPLVRSTAARALGALGNPVVATLDTVARTQPDAARGAITALTLAGPTGVAAVRRMTTDHADERLRDFARLALGEGPPAH